METILSVCIGLGLAAACGFRIFVPLLIVSIASRTGHLQLASSFAWLGTDAALITFAAATVMEVVGYYVPWFDHFLDTVATPAAVVAGTVVAAAVFTNIDPYLRWTLAAIAGGGAAGLVQGGTVVTRGLSTALTGGLGNPVVATAELGLSAFTSVLSLIAPLLAAVAVLALVGWVGPTAYRRFARRTAAPPVIELR